MEPQRKALISLIKHKIFIKNSISGDSWRARARHVTELQFSMSYDNMRINFGGMDRWDQPERARNMDEAENHIGP
jgi:hypothetical protein